MAAKTRKEDREWWAINRITNSARKMKPTLKHRPALTFGILGTCYGINSEGEVRYFDYDWAGALKFAGIADDKLELLEGVDLRRGRAPRTYTLPKYDMWNPERQVRKGQPAWWVLKEETPTK